MPYLGLDPDRSQHLGDVVARWPSEIEDIHHQVLMAENLGEMAAEISADLENIARAGRAIAAAIDQAVDTATSFRLDARMALLVDHPIGAAYEPAIVAHALATGETYRQAQIRREIDVVRAELATVPPRHRDTLQRQIAALRSEHQSIDPPGDGDAGGTLTAEVRTPFAPSAATPRARGTAIVTHALRATTDSDEVQADEFHAIFHDNGNMTLVLPGVVDLTAPDFGLHATHRSARDLDQHALRSLLDSKTSSNVYAQLIAQWLATQVAVGAIARGTDTLIVGHSFGADTALDLASDSHVNGGLVNITHVIPAGYHSEPQLNDVVNQTQVGVLQNIYDVPVIVEGLAGDLAARHDDSRGRDGSGVAGLVRPFARDLVDDTIDELPGQGFIAEFAGGIQGAGHHPNNYITYLERAALPALVTNMMTDIGRSGYGTPGVSLAIDVSTPHPPMSAPMSQPSSPKPSGRTTTLPRLEPVDPATILLPALGAFDGLVPRSASLSTTNLRDSPATSLREEP